MKHLRIIASFPLAAALCACAPAAGPQAGDAKPAQSEPLNDTTGEPETESATLSPLHVDGPQLLDDRNQPVILQGYSTFGINYKPEYVNENTFRFLKEEMGSQVIRLAMYTADSNGYCTGGDQEQLEGLIDKGVQAAVATGQYVIIDWHILSDGNPAQYQDQARAFFQKVTRKYAGNPAVIYELCNEPNGRDVTWPVVKSYAEAVIQEIRANDKNALILVGTPQWDQAETEAGKDLLKDAGNMMYTVHFYAATHKDQQRQDLSTAYDQKLPMFVSEFGFTEASGNGALDEQSGQTWIDLLDQDKISRVAWATSDKDEASSIFRPGTNPDSPSLSDLTEWGQWLRKAYTGKDTSEEKDSQDTSGSSEKTAELKSGDNELEVSLRQSNTWNSDGMVFTQFDLTLTNHSDQPVTGWSEALQFTKDVTINQSWNGEISASGSTVTVNPGQYHATIQAGESVKDIGFIVKSDGMVEQK
ncbi:cellulase family glycosylhydrolase [Faecalibaculum rodentium]|uniref:cellulase family glycosylhydrolase n=1 Tax=Faecalibaculum rodentium TaxID=1702221 RepID=UPI0026F3AA44|nr:cellulase family glycosylhydrolase [Faecalibaculum rodentium]